VVWNTIYIIVTFSWQIISKNYYAKLDLFPFHTELCSLWQSTFLDSSHSTTRMHWPCYCIAHVYIVINFCDSMWFYAGFSLSFVYICIAVGDQANKRGKLGSIDPATLYNYSKSGLKICWITKFKFLVNCHIYIVYICIAFVDIIIKRERIPFIWLTPPQWCALPNIETVFPTSCVVTFSFVFNGLSKIRGECSYCDIGGIVVFCVQWVK
jgi:hypothetical protein